MASPSTPPLTGQDLLGKPSLLLVLVAGLYPGLDASGFAPFFSLSPATAALVAGVGGAMGGALAAKERLRGAITGCAVSAGITLGMIAYVIVRLEVLDSETFLRLELVLGGLLGAVPGLLLYRLWFKARVDAWKRAQVEASASGARG